MEKKPSRMFEVLLKTGALARIIPELKYLVGVPQPIAHHPEGDVWTHVIMVVDQAAAEQTSLEVRWAALLHDLGKGVTPSDKWPAHHGHEELSVPLVKAVCERLKVPATCRDLAIMGAQFHGIIHRANDLRPNTIVNLFSKVDAFRRPNRFFELLQVCRCDARGRLGRENDSYKQMDVLSTAFESARGIDAGAIAKSCTNPTTIPARIHAARVAAVKNR